MAGTSGSNIDTRTDTRTDAQTDARNEAFLERWHRIVAERDLAGLHEELAEDVSLGVPPYWQRIEGRDTAEHLLGLVIHAIEDFTYHREWHDDSRGAGEIALEFHGHVGEFDLQGIDLITLNDRNMVQNLDVLIRPMNALANLREVIAPQMMDFLNKQSG